MGTVRIALVVILSVVTAWFVPRPQPASASTVPVFDHVFVIVMENHSYNEIIGNSGAPYINSLANSGGLATNYHAVAHPSLPNYIAMTAASTFGITSDCTTCWISAGNIADSIESAGKSWKAYMESMPSPCFVGDSYPYVQKHDPFIYFNDIRTNAARCQAHVVPYTQLARDLTSTTTTPSFSFITPNICNDMHDCSVATGDGWLRSQLPLITGSAAFKSQRSLIALTWDEDDSSGTNQVATLLIGSGVGNGSQSSLSYSHYSLLHTFEASLGLTTLTSNDAGGVPMADLFNPAQVFGTWTSLGAAVTSSPDASARSATAVDAFVRGQDNAVWHVSLNGQAWGSMQSIGGAATSGPGAVSWGPSRVDVFARGQDEGLWHAWWNGSAWSAWYPLGGVLTSRADAASWGLNRLDVFARGQDNALWHLSWNGNRWSGWQSLGGVLSSDPTAVSWGANRIDVFGLGQDKGLWHISWNGSAWSAWQSLGGALTSAPDAASCGPGRLDIFALGTDSGIWQESWNGSWSGWRSVGGQWTSAPASVCRTGSIVEDLFARGADGSMWHEATVGS